MVTKLTLLVILAFLHRGNNTPLRQLNHPNEIPILVPAHQATLTIIPQHIETHQNIVTVHPQTVPQGSIAVPTSVHHGSLTVNPQTVPSQHGTITIHSQNVPTHQGTLTIHPQTAQQIFTVPANIRESHPHNQQSVNSQNVPTKLSQTIHSPNAIVTTRQKKGPNFISFPISQILIPKFHVIPQSNIHHSSVHTDKYNIQTVSHTTSNITHPLIPVLIPIHHNLVSVQDLSVIPLQKNVHQKLGQFRVMEKMDEEEEQQVNRFRTFYGGYGTGLFFGGHGAGHGFHIFG